MVAAYPPPMGEEAETLLVKAQGNPARSDLTGLPASLGTR